MEKTINFGKIAYDGNRKINQVEVRIELKECKDGPVFSACAYVWNSRHTDCVAGGQCIDTLYKYFRGNVDYMNIYELWARNHLNDMHAGTVLQEQALDKAGREGYDVSDYCKQCQYLQGRSHCFLQKQYLNYHQYVMLILMNLVKKCLQKLLVSKVRLLKRLSMVTLKPSILINIRLVLVK